MSFVFRAFWRDTKKPVKDFMEQYTIEALNDEHFIVHQGSGQTDKNGREIYFGDIVRDIPQDRAKLVCQLPNNDWIVKYPDASQKYNWYDGLYDRSKHCEIIGNIVTNPDLIKIYE